MKDLFLILLFSKTLLLTPEPINITGSYELSPNEPLSAITEGANLAIDVSSIIKPHKNEDIDVFHNRLFTKFPENSIKAILTNKNNKKDEVILTFKRAHSTGQNNNKIEIYLYADQGMPKNHEYDTLKIVSEVELKNVLISWANFSW